MKIGRCLLIVFVIILMVIQSNIRAANGADQNIIEGSLNEWAYTSIQDAIDDAKDGEIILVNDGTYFENIDFKGKGIILIKSNTAEDDGGGIYCVNSSPRFIYCTIRNNITSWWGGGIYCENHSSPILTTCIVDENTSLSGDGGGIYCFYNSSPEIADCKIRNNTAYMNGGGIYCNNNSSPRITNCTISINSTSVGDGSGFFFDNSSPVVLNNILWGNMSGGNSGQIFLGSYVLYSSYKFLSSGNDDRISIPVYNQLSGRWKACYRFFGKTCGENLPIQSCNIIFIFYLI